MKIRKALAAGFAATMLLAACGGGDSARDELLKSLEEEGDLTDDQKDCIEGVADGFSDSELEEIKKETEDADPADFGSFSGKSQEFMDGMIGCMTGAGSPMIEDIIAGLPEEIPAEAQECIRQELTGLGADELASLADDPTVAMDLVTDCMAG